MRAPLLRRGQASVRGRYRADLKKGFFAGLQASPAYGIAGFMHLLLLVGLSFWTIAVHISERNEPLVVSLAPKKEIVPVTAGLDREAEALDALLDASQKDLDTISENDTNDAFNEARGVESGEVNVFGVGQGGRSGIGRGGSANRPGGASKASTGALKGGLDWLIRHRNQQKVWTTLGPDHVEGRIKGPGDVARTALAVLCFVAAKHGPDRTSSKYHGAVITARDWLVDQVGPKGRFKTAGGPRSQWYHCYEQALGTLALSECLSRQVEPRVGKAVQRAVGYIERTQSPGAGWRYGRGDTDTSVTSWMVLALKSAEHAGVSVRSSCFDGVRSWLRKVGSPSGTAGYTSRSNPSQSMTATGLFLRITLGELPTTKMNRAAARLVARSRLSTQKGTVQNFYGIYYAALAMYQVGGSQWRKFNPLIRDGLVSTQRRGTSCERGSWRGSGHINGPVLATTFATLTLETYYRYMPIHEGTGEAPEEEEQEPEEQLTPGESQLEVATVALMDARTEADGGAVLAAEAAYARALKTLEREKASWEQIGEAKARLVEIAMIAKDTPLLKQRIDDYMSSVPRSETADPAVSRLRRLERYRAVMGSAQTAFGPEGTPAQQEAAKRDLLALQGLLAGEVGGLEEGSDEHTECDRMLAEVEDVHTKLAFSVNPDQAIGEALASVQQRPAQGPIGAQERRLLMALLVRANERFAKAAKEEDSDAFVAGAEDFERYTARRPSARLTIRDFQRLGPLIERTMLNQGAALLTLGDARGAVASAQRFLERFPESKRREQAETIERGGLALLVKVGDADEAQRSRLSELIARWSKGRKDLPPKDALALGDLLLAAGNLEAAAGHYVSCVTQGAQRPVENAARVGLARIARQRGDLDEALGHLEGIRADPQGERLDVTLERCLVWREQGKAQEALKEYLLLVRALNRKDDNEVSAWWGVAEEAGRTYVEAGQVEEGRKFLEEVRRKDRTFGGNEQRRLRFVKLMRELDLMR